MRIYIKYDVKKKILTIKSGSPTNGPFITICQQQDDTTLEYSFDVKAIADIRIKNGHFYSGKENPK